MKKLLTTIAILVLTAVAVMAQSRAIGVRAGYNFEISYQHSVGSESGMIEVDAGISPFLSQKVLITEAPGDSYERTYRYGRAQAMILYDYIMNPATNFNLYFGAGIGVRWGYGDIFSPYSNQDVKVRRLGLPIGAQVGLEYELPIPLNLSLDWRPTVNLFDFRESLASKLLNVAIGIRYRF